MVRVLKVLKVLRVPKVVRVLGCAGTCLLIAVLAPMRVGTASERHFLYVAEPGIRNYVEYGGVGVLVYDIDAGHRFVRRIPTFPAVAGQEPENVKGIAAHAGTSRLYVSTHKRLAAFDLTTDKMIWSKTYDGGCDRLAISPDGKVLYVPSFEGPHWHAVDAMTGDVIAKVVTSSGAHNTIFGPAGTRVYMAGLKLSKLLVADPSTNQVVTEVGPFSNVVRPFTINGAETLCFVNVNDLLGFEVGDLKTGKMLYRVEVPGYKKGPVKRHGCPSHGLGLTPDESELWLADGANNAVHVFDATKAPPSYRQTIMLRDQPGWITFSVDGRYAYPSTGEVVDTKTKRIVTALSDETGRQVQSEKVVEVVFDGKRPVATGDQFGIGRRRGPS
jgi:DNA-binding beta-propeller fold protein YncE